MVIRERMRGDGAVCGFSDGHRGVTSSEGQYEETKEKEKTLNSSSPKHQDYKQYLRSHSEDDSGCLVNTGSTFQDSSMSYASSGRSFYNPFLNGYLQRLRYPVCSPSLFESFGKATKVTDDESEKLSFTTSDIDDTDVLLYNESLDTETEKAAQEAISKFFEEAPDLLVTPQKALLPIPLTPDMNKDKDDTSLQYTCDPLTLEQEMDHSTTWAQTCITFPKLLPDEVEVAFMDFATKQHTEKDTEEDIEEDIEDDTGELMVSTRQELSNIDCMEESQFDDEKKSLSKERNNKVTVCCQTMLSFRVNVPESLENTLSLYETYYEDIYTDIRMSMMRRQLFGDAYESSPQFHSSSPLSWVAESSPLQSGSLFSPQCSSIRQRHHGSPMGDIISPTGVSPIARPTKSIRILSKLDFLSWHPEELISSSPRSISSSKGMALASSEEEEDNHKN